MRERSGSHVNLRLSRRGTATGGNPRVMKGFGGQSLRCSHGITGHLEQHKNTADSRLWED